MSAWHNQLDIAPQVEGHWVRATPVDEFFSRFLNLSLPK